MRVAIYARVSTDSQDTEMQLAKLRPYCEAREWILYREYIDAAVSGSKESRPQLNELMADARKRKFDVVLVWAFDRFGRSSKHLLTALEEFGSLRIEFCSYQQQIDTTGPAGKLFFTIVAAFAEFERAMIVERVKAGIGNARAKGVRLGRPASGVDIARVRLLRSQGKPFRAIARLLGVGVGTVVRAAHFQERSQ